MALPNPQDDSVESQESQKSQAVVVGNGDTPDAITPAAGELAFEESTKGGMGRHMGVFSTIFLMYDGRVF